MGLRIVSFSSEAARSQSVGFISSGAYVDVYEDSEASDLSEILHDRRSILDSLEEVIDKLELVWSMHI